MEQIQSNRWTEIDILKGIAILSVIWYHLGLEDNLAQYFSSFHMILFFSVSGFCYKKDAIRINPRGFLTKKAHKLLKPYILWVILYTILNVIIDVYSNIDRGLGQYLLNLVTSYMSFGAIWFLMALFITTTVGGVIIDYINNDIQRVCISCLPVIVALVGKNFDLISIFRWEQAFVAVPAFLMGFIYGKQYNSRKPIPNLIVRAFLFGLVGVVLSFCNGWTIVSRLEFGKSFFLFYIGALISIYAWFCVSACINKKCEYLRGALAFCGRNSIYILVTHQIVILFVRKLIVSFFPEIGNIAAILCFVIVVLVEIPLCFMCKRKLFKWMF